jgi:hypothetical protein
VAERFSVNGHWQTIMGTAVFAPRRHRDHKPWRVLFDDRTEAHWTQHRVAQGAALRQRHAAPPPPPPPPPLSPPSWPPPAPPPAEARGTQDDEETTLARRKLESAPPRPGTHMLAATAPFQEANVFRLGASASGHYAFGRMDVTCGACGALMWIEERTSGSADAPRFSTCCHDDIVRLPPLGAPPEPLRELLAREHPRSNHFLRNIRAYNGALSMASTSAPAASSRTRHPVSSSAVAYTITSPAPLTHCRACSRATLSCTRWTKRPRRRCACAT